MLTVALVFVVITNHTSASTDAITIRRDTVATQGKLAIPAHDAIVRRRPKAHRTGWGTQLTSCAIAETPVWADSSSARHRLHGVALGTVIGILCEALFESDAYATPICA